MKRLILLPLLLVVAACSGHTTYRFEVDVLSFIPQDQRQGEVELTTAQVRFPDDPAGQLVEVPGAEVLVDGRLEISLIVKNTGILDSNLSLEVRLGPKDDTNLYDEQGGDFSAVRQTVSLAPGAEKTVTLTLDVSPNTQAFNLIQSGQFRMGTRLSLSEGRVQYTLTQAELVLGLKPFNLVSNP